MLQIKKINDNNIKITTFNLSRVLLGYGFIISVLLFVFLLIPHKNLYSIPTIIFILTLLIPGILLAFYRKKLYYNKITNELLIKKGVILNIKKKYTVKSLYLLKFRPMKTNSSLFNHPDKNFRKTLSFYEYGFETTYNLIQISTSYTTIESKKILKKISDKTNLKIIDKTSKVGIDITNLKKIFDYSDTIINTPP